MTPLKVSSGVIGVDEVVEIGWIKYSVEGYLGSSEGFDTYQSGGKVCEDGL